MQIVPGKLTFLTVVALFFTYISFAQVTDSDGKIYKTKKISTQTWMAENLTVSHFANGDLIPEAKTPEDWVKASNDETPSWCYYDNDPIKGKKYGKLYNWYAVTDSRGLAPKGWKVPDRDDWYKLDSYLQTLEFKLSSIVNDAGKAMKTLAGWNQKSNGNNKSGFSALPSGICVEGFFFKIGDAAYWWSSTDDEYSDDDAQDYVMHGICGYLDLSEGLYIHHVDKGFGFSVRCMKK